MPERWAVASFEEETKKSAYRRNESTAIHQKLHSYERNGLVRPECILGLWENSGTEMGNWMPIFELIWLSR